jgi:cell division septum initiation protein DivIVA
MQKKQQTSSGLSEIENLLDEVYTDLTELSEENFDQRFISAKLKMEQARKVKIENSSKFVSFKPSKKIEQLAKLISEKYDNVTKDWANKLKQVQKEIELSQNQKKITNYNR